MAEPPRDVLLSGAGRRLSDEMTTRFTLAVHSTRVPRPGEHRVDVLVNGQAKPAGSFRVIATPRD